MILTTIQLAILILLPLLLYYRRVDLRIPQIVLFIAIVYVIWYATYSALHELRHLLPLVVMNERIIDIQLFPHFLQGELSGGHITTQYSSVRNEFVGVVFPYLTDILLAILGAVVLTKLVPRPGPLIFGLMLTVFVTSPLFDVVNNYVAFVIGSDRGNSTYNFLHRQEREQALRTAVMCSKTCLLSYHRAASREIAS